MKSYKITIAGVDRELPICPVNDELSIGAFVILGDAELSEAAARELLKLAPEYDYILTAEAKGITLAHEMARQNKDRTYFVARKTPKLYMTGVFQVDVRSITTAKDQMLYLDTAEAALMKDKRILLVDDVISTGESIYAVEKLVKKAGGHVVGRMAILAEGDAQKRDDIIFLEKLPVFNPDGSIKY